MVNKIKEFLKEENEYNYEEIKEKYSSNVFFNNLRKEIFK
jgi:hypothetical protein